MVFELIAFACNICGEMVSVHQRIQLLICLSWYAKINPQPCVLTGVCSLRISSINQSISLISRCVHTHKRTQLRITLQLTEDQIYPRDIEQKQNTIHIIHSKTIHL